MGRSFNLRLAQSRTATPVRDIIVLADGDTIGEAAAKNCASRWSRGAARTCPPPAWDGLQRPACWTRGIYRGRCCMTADTKDPITEAIDAAEIFQSDRWPD